MARRWPAFLLMALALAGCSEEGPGGDPAEGPAPPASDGGPATGPLPADGPTRLAMLGCTYFTTGFYASAEQAASRLPAGLQVEEVAPGIGSILLETYTCSSMVLDNQTTFRDVAVALSLIQVVPDPAIARDGAFHSFVLEAFASDMSLAAALSGRGLPARQARIAADIGPVAEARITAEGVSYEWVATGGGSQAEGAFTRRLFQTPSSWIDVDYTWDWEGLNREAFLTSSEGAIGPLVLGGVGRGAPGDFDGSFVWNPQ